MVATAKTASATAEETQLKQQGVQKLNIASQLTGGRELLDVLSSRDTSGRTSERLRSALAVQLGNEDIESSARIKPVDSRVAASVGSAALGASEEDALTAGLGIIEADLGLESTASSSLRVAAQSEAQLANSILAERTANQNQNLDLFGSVVGAGVTAFGGFSKVDPLANPNQIRPDLDNAILTNPNANRRATRNRFTALA